MTYTDTEIDKMTEFAMRMAQIDDAPFNISKREEGRIEITAGERLCALYYVLTKWDNARFTLINSDGKVLLRGYYRFSECPTV